METEKTMETQSAAAGNAERRWYVIHTATGYEKKVKDDLDRKIHSMGLENTIFTVEVPEAEETVAKDGRKPKKVKHKLFPGYVLVEMLMTNFSWYVVRNTPGVTRFVGPDGTKPSPLSQSEVDHIRNMNKTDFSVKFAPGEGVEVASGTFQGFPATVVTVDEAKRTLKALINIMGRETETEFSFDDIKKIV